MVKVVASCMHVHVNAKAAAGDSKECCRWPRQAKRLRMSYTREYELHGSCEGVPRDKSVPNSQTIPSQHENDQTLGN